jgi:hypothetical protein
MHHKYKDQGLVLISVNLNDAHDDDDRKDTLKLLKKYKLDVINVVLDEPQEVWKEKLRIRVGPPCMYVFDRDGKWRMLYGEILQDDEGNVRHAVVEALIQKLLAK